MRGYRPVVRDPVRRLHLPGLRPDHHAAGQDDQPARAARSRCPSSSACPTAATSARSSTTRRAPEAYFAHTAGLRVVSPSTPHDAYWMIQEAIALGRPRALLRAQEPLLAQGRGRPRREPARRCTPAASCAPARMSTLVGHGAAWSACCCRPPSSPPRRARSLEVIDLRSLSPIDYGPVLDSVQQDRPPGRRARRPPAT